VLSFITDGIVKLIPYLSPELLTDQTYSFSSKQKVKIPST
jgi:hypothetical protein